MTSGELKLWLNKLGKTHGDDIAKQAAVWIASRCASRAMPIFYISDIRSHWTKEVLWALTTSRVASTWPTRDVAASATANAAFAASAARVADVRWLKTHNFQFPEQPPILWSLSENPIHNIWLEGQNNIRTVIAKLVNSICDCC